MPDYFKECVRGDCVVKEHERFLAAITSTLDCPDQSIICFIPPLSIGSINALSITSPQPECNERATSALFLDVLEFCFLLRAASFTILLEVTPLANRDDCCLESEHTKPRAHVSTLLKARYTRKAGGMNNLL